MSMPLTEQVHQAWAMPGAVPVSGWEVTQAVQEFLGAAGMGSTLDSSTSVLVAPVGAQVKGTDGPGWVLACVLVTATVRGTTTAKAAYGHCERMQWNGATNAGRWMIAPGAAPVHAPSTWPGTDLAGRAGWKTWTSQGGDA